MIACSCWIWDFHDVHVRVSVQSYRVAVRSSNCSHRSISEHVASECVKDVRASLDMCACCCSVADCAVGDCSVESSRVAKSASSSLSQSHVIIKTVCVTCLLALPRNPLSREVLSRLLRSIAFVEMSVMLSAVGTFLVAKLFASTMSWIHK